MFYPNFQTDSLACCANNRLLLYQCQQKRTLVPPPTTFVNAVSTTSSPSNSISERQTIRNFTTKDSNNDKPKNHKFSDINLETNSIEEFRAREEQRESEADKKTEKIETDNNSSNTSHQQNFESAKMTKIRNDILDAALLFVSVHGWSRDAIANGAEQCGYPGIVHGMFPNGGIELINHFYMQCNERLMTQLNDELMKNTNDDGATDETPQKTIETPLDMLKRAITLRLQMNEPYLSNWHQALAVMAMPPNVPTSLAQLLTLVDDICHYAGDRSVDVSIIYFIEQCAIETNLLFL